MEKKKHTDSRDCTFAFSRICLCAEVKKAQVFNYVCCGMYHAKTLGGCGGKIVYSGKVK